jgi:PAS domain S-box-containing protein
MAEPRGNGSGGGIEAFRGERILAAIVEDSEDAILSKTLDGTIVTWNRGAQQLYGYTGAEAVGQRISLLVPRDRKGEEDLLLARLARGERIEHYETQRVNKRGEILDVSVTLSPIFADDGRWRSGISAGSRWPGIFPAPPASMAISRASTLLGSERSATRQGRSRRGRSSNSSIPTTENEPLPSRHGS